MSESRMTIKGPGHAHGAADGRELFVGDEVAVRGVVVRSIAGVGALVRFRSKTEDYEGWICEDDLRWAIVNDDLPAEPVDGTWLLAYPGSNSRVFHRDDAEGHNDRDDRRHDRHWWDVVAEEWIDWPTAVRRGAGDATAREMTVHPGASQP